MIPAILLAAALQNPSSPTNEITFRGHGGMRLKGTLELPAGETNKKHPAILLLPGSGPTDRNGNQPPYLVTDLLKSVADALAAAGIASLRFDKRSAHVYAKAWPKDEKAQNEFFSWESFVGDARAALSYLRKRKEIDPAKVGIAGHSEGGLIALQLGHDLKGKDAPAALILLGTAGRSLDRLVREQVADALRRQGAIPEVEKAYLGHVDKAIASIVNTETVPEDLPAGLAPLFPKSATKLLKTYFTLQPAPLAAAYAGPVLILNGEFDSQVLAKEDPPRLERAFMARKSGTVEVLIVPGASHNFKPVQSAQEPGFAGPVAPAMLERLVDWSGKSLGR